MWCEIRICTVELEGEGNGAWCGPTVWKHHVTKLNIPKYIVTFLKAENSHNTKEIYIHFQIFNFLFENKTS